MIEFDYNLDYKNLMFEKNGPKPPKSVKERLFKGPLKLSLSSQGGCIPVIPLWEPPIVHPFGSPMWPPCALSILIPV